MAASLNFCGCQERGTDVCGCKKSFVPRPHPVQIPRLNIPAIKSICREPAPVQPRPFSPIGDACNCGQKIVKPAPLPNNRHNVSWKSFSENVTSWNFFQCLQRHLPQINLPRPQCNCGRSNDKPEEHSEGCNNAVRAPEQYQSFSQDGATIYFQTAKKSAP